MIMVLNLESVHAQTTPAQNGRHPATHHPARKQPPGLLLIDSPIWDLWTAQHSAGIVASMPKN